MLKVCTTLFGNKILIPEEKITDRPSVYGVIRNKSKYLFVNTRRTGKYWFPGGGIDDDPSREQALIREVKEEAGIEIKIEKLIAEVESYFYYDPTGHAFRQLAAFYLCLPLTFTVTDSHNPDKADEANEPKWVDLVDINEDNFQDYGAEIFNLSLNI